jgi:hypothetical protein
MSRNAFSQSEREYNGSEEQREHSAMERKASIADSAIYQHTLAQAEKYKAQRDKLVVIAKQIVDNGVSFAEMKALESIIAEVEQSL